MTPAHPIQSIRDGLMFRFRGGIKIKKSPGACASGFFVEVEQVLVGCKLKIVVLKDKQSNEG